MSGRVTPLYGKRRSHKKPAGAKPNADRQRVLAARKRKRKNSALQAMREAAKAEKAVAASE